MNKKNRCFFVGVPLFSFLLETFSTLLTLHCPKCILHVNIHMDKVINVMFVENISIWNVTSETISKKQTLDCFGFQVGDIKISDNFYKIEKFKYRPVFSPNNHYWFYTFLIPWALKRNYYYAQDRFHSQKWNSAMVLLASKKPKLHETKACKNLTAMFKWIKFTFQTLYLYFYYLCGPGAWPRNKAEPNLA